ncbi:hypothetical protein DMN91_003910 [Ooceraea biroi]|uniref:Uncharacterized protein n=1 Tax=Ooceraea biroi TaxID=2015173 RepID=A0A3L8DTJ3_OOCBI|nr:hypothetical protein DMN91_003910 [Ooceraea biroi]
MKDQLLEASEMQGVILNSQKEGLRIQNELLDHGKELGTVLKTSSETVNNMVSDFKKVAITLCAITLFYTSYCYKDGQLENQKALRRIEQQLDVIEKITTISNSQPIRCSKRLALKRIQAVSGKRENVTHAKAAGQSL